MLKISLPPARVRRLLTQHSDRLLPLVKRRLNVPTASFLKGYFSDDTKINEMLLSFPDKLELLHADIYMQLRAFTKVHIDAALKKVFDPAHFFDKTTVHYNAFDLCREIGLITCPYCNINFVNTIYQVKTHSLVLRPPLDHFMPFSLFPALGMSFYNLVPACWVCNSSFKLSKPTSTSTHLNPYMAGFGKKCAFRLGGYKKIDDILSKTGEKFDIRLKRDPGDTRPDGNIDLFKLELVYNEFKPIAKQTFAQATLYPKAQIDSIARITRSNRLDAYQFIFQSGYKEADHHQTPFAKLKRDITAEYGTPEVKALMGL